MEKRAKNPVKTAQKTLRIIEQLEDGPQRLKTVTNAVDMQKAAVFNHLATLVEAVYVVKEGNQYRLSLKFLKIGGHLRHRNGLYQLAGPKVKELARETGEIANMIVEERGLGIYIAHERGEDAVELNTHIGLTTSLHATALGKAILAHTPRDRVEEIVANRGLVARTPQTITDEDVLFDRLETVRERGFAIDDGERQEGLRCVGAPIQEKNGDVIGAISLSAPATRVSTDELTGEFAETVTSVANVIELEVKY
jgi:DNA-binding IclR family transcriptional regulator